jgi:hypothetical protein
MSKSGKNHNLSGYYARQKDHTVKNKLKRRLKRERRSAYWDKNEAYQAKQAERKEKYEKRQNQVGKG